METTKFWLFPKVIRLKALLRLLTYSCCKGFDEERIRSFSTDSDLTTELFFKGPDYSFGILAKADTG